MQRLRKGLYLLQSAGFANAYLIEGARGLTLVDAGHARSSELLVEEIHSAGFDLREVEQILLTHWHADHSAGAAHFVSKRRVRVVAHVDDASALSGRPPRPVGLAARVVRILSDLWFPLQPLETLVPLGPKEPLRGLPSWQLLHTPGHTRGSLSLYHPTDQVLVCGDALTNRRGALGLSSPLVTEDPQAAAATVRRLALLPCEMLCCGHGPVVRRGAGLRIHALAERLQAAH